MRDPSDAHGRLNADGSIGPLLSSRSNPRIRRIRRLARRRERERGGVIWVEGSRELDRALQGGCIIEELYVRADRLYDPGLPAAPVRVPVAPKIWSELVYRENTVWSAGLVRLPDGGAIDWSRSLLVLDGVEKPGNVGAVLRSADAAGFPQVAICGGVDRGNPNLIRASLGACFLVPFFSVSRSDLQYGVVASRLPVRVLRPGGKCRWPPILPEPVVLVLGAEDRGVDHSWDALGETLSLPMRGRVDSLNVAQAATILMYQRLAQLEAAE